MRFSRLLQLTTIVAILLSVGMAPVFAGSYYVSPTGMGDCSVAAPCALSVGLGRVGPGDEVILLDGVYNEPLYVTKGGAEGAPVLIRAANKHQAIIQKNNDRLARIWASYVIVRGIQFDGQKSGGNRGAVRVGQGDEIALPSRVHDVILEQIWVHDVRAAAVCVTSGEYNIIVRDSLIERSGFYEFWGEGFYLGHKTDPNQTVYNLEIYNNIVRGTTENAVECKKFSRNVVVRNNRMYGQVLWADYGGDATRGNDGTITLDGHSHTVYGNLLYNNKCGTAAFVVEPEANIKVYNNVIYDGVAPGSAAVRMKNWSKSWPIGQYPPSQVYNNTFYNLVNHSVGTLDPSIMVVRNNIGLDLEGNAFAKSCNGDLYLDCDTGNFELLSSAGSYAIDKVTSAPYSTVDMRGAPIAGSARDYGAMEFGSVGTTPSTPPPPTPPPPASTPVRPKPPTGLKVDSIRN